MKKICLILIVLICFVGCSGNTTTVCKIENARFQDTMTLNSENDNVVEIHEKIIVDWKQYQAKTEEEKQQLKSIVLEQFSNLEGIEGVVVTSGDTDDALIITIDVDVQKADLVKLNQMGFITSTDDNLQISLEKSVEELKTSGYLCE